MLLHSAVKGSGAPHNIWLHAFLGTGQNFSRIARNIVGTNYMLDLPNHGNSFHARYTRPHQVANDILKFAEANQIEKFNLIGHSMGGRIAMHTANLLPMVDKVVVMDIAPIDTTEIYKNINKMWKHILSGMSRINLKGKTKIEISQELEQITYNKSLAQFLSNGLGETNEGYHWKYGLEQMMKIFDDGLYQWIDFNPKLRNPGLAIFGEDSAYTVQHPGFKDMLEAFDRNFEDWKYEIIPGGDHFVHNSAQGLVEEKINSFITS